MCWERRPRLIGCQVAPPSSVRNGRRDGDEHPLRVGGVLDDGVETHPSGTRRPVRPRAVFTEPRDLLPRPAAVLAAEEGGVLDAGVDRIRIVERRLEVPHPLELPGMRGPVVPLVGAGHPVVGELVAHRFPGLAPVVRALRHLTEPAARLRAVDPVGVGRRPLEVVDLPPREVRAAHLPLLALPIGAEHEPALAGPHQQAYAAHLQFPPELTRWLLGAGPVPAQELDEGAGAKSTSPGGAVKRYSSA